MARVPANEGLDVNMKTCFLMNLSGLLLVTQSAWAIGVDETGCLEKGKGLDKEMTRLPVDKEAFRQAHDEAECLRKAAAAARAEWIETESLLKRSMEAADSGEWEEASQLVQKAHFQARTALQQAEHEAEAWKHRVVK